MEWYQWLSFFGVSALFGAILVDIYTRFKTGSKKIMEKKKQENKKELEAVVKEVVSTEIKPIKEDVATIRKEIDSIKSNDIKVLKVANRDSLRNQLLTVFRECEEKGYQTTEDTRNFQYMLDSYRNLDGNSFITNVAKQMEHIPTKID